MYFLRSICNGQTSVFETVPRNRPKKVYHEVILLRTQEYFEWIIKYFMFKICLGKMNCLNAMKSRWLLQSLLKLTYLRLRLPKPNDSNDYLYRLIYFLSCNNYLPFHVFKTSFNEIRSPNHYISRLKDVEHFDWFFWLNMRNSCFVFFQELSSCACKSCFFPWSRIYQPQHNLLYFIDIYFFKCKINLLV